MSQTPAGQLPRRTTTLIGARLHRVVAVAILPILALPAVGVSAAASTTAPAAVSAPAAAPVTYTSAGLFPPCPAGRYVVPAGIRFVRVVATGGAGTGGGSYSDNNTGGPGGSGATVTTILPVSAGQSLTVVAGRSGNNDNNDFYSGWPDGGANGYNLGQGGGSSYVTTQPLVASTGCQDLSTSHLDRSAMLVLAGGGGGGGGSSVFGSGGGGGNAGVNADLSGQAGSTAYHLDSDCGQGGGGGGGYATGPGTYGAGACLGASNGKVGDGFYGGHDPETAHSGVSAGGAGGGGWYGGGSGGSGNGLGGGGGGAGSSYVSSTARTTGISQATTGPSVTITALPTPTTTATTGAGSALVDWYTSSPTITLTGDAAGGAAVDRTYYAIDNTDCSYNTAGCTRYTGPFTVGPGLHTLTIFTVNALELDGVVQTRSFAVTSTSAGVTAASLDRGTNPTASAGGPAGTPGTISVNSTGTGAVGTAVYGTNPAGTPAFNSSGAYVDVLVAGSGLSSLTILNCDLNGGTNVYWWNGTAWAVVSNQTYDATTSCVTVTVNSTTKPSISQLTGTVIAAGRPPSTTATATTADGKSYTPGTWTNQSVTVAFTCTANATPTGPVTITQDGQGQAASGTCTDGVGQQTTTTFTGINVDKTPPSCTITISPANIWSPNGKPVTVTGTVTASDNLAGIAQVVGGPVTSNETLGVRDVQGFTVNTTYTSPLKASATIALSGTLLAKRLGGGTGRTYTQLVTVTDQAGNTASCTWTAAVAHDKQ